VAATEIDVVIGRERELAAIAAFVESIPNGSCALLLEGEPGIGKTTLWLEGVSAATAAGHRVLEARPAESEAKLSYTALGDLLGTAFDETRAALPAPQERALAAALLLESADEPPEARTIATAVLGVLTALARDGPVLVAIDDSQWLDPASKGALEFAFRRLPSAIGLLVALRAEDEEEVPLALDRSFAEGRLTRVVPGPLSLASLHHLIGTRLATTPSRVTLTRIAEASGGNPLFALEIARALVSAAEEHRRDDPLPIPRSLQKLVGDRLGALSPPAQDVVLAAAALSRPTVPAVVAALSPEFDVSSALREAEDARVLVASRERIRFTHPLLASAVYGSSSDARRRDLHRRLAEVVTDPEERARHLAQSVVEPDPTIADEIERGGRDAALRGAHAAAAELFEAARLLTPSGRREELARRALGQAAALLKTGEVAGARTLAEGVDDEMLPRALKAAKFEQLAGIEWDAGATKLATAYLERALDADLDDREFSARILKTLVLMSVPLNPARGLQHAERAMTLLDENTEPAFFSSVLIDHMWARAFLGQGIDWDFLQRGLDLEVRAGPEASPHPVPLILFQCLDDVEPTRARHASEDQWAYESGDERLRAERLGYLWLVELRAGRWDLAEECAERSCETLGNSDVSGPYAHTFAWRSLIDAYRGRFERARTTLLPLIEEAKRTETEWWQAVMLDVLGFVEFCAGDYRAADRALTRMRELFSSSGIEDGFLDRSEPFHVELLVTLGELRRARDILERLEWRGRTCPRLWIDVTLPRARALVAAAEGDLTTALTLLEELDLVAASRLPFELAWAWLVKGRIHRRLNQRRAATEALREALAIFERLRAPTWIEQTTRELERVRPRRRSSDGLTPTELRVAELAAGGLTNREVAKEAFMSAKTVEANLTRVYRKLGIRSRAELGARMAEQTRGAGTKT